MNLNAHVIARTLRGVYIGTVNVGPVDAVVRASAPVASRAIVRDGVHTGARALCVGGRMDEATWRQEYARVLASPMWRAKRAQCIEQTGGRCERCGDASERLELHHLHYRTLGDEARGDVALLCPHCHGIADSARVTEQASARHGRRTNAAKRTYLRKRYGDDYDPTDPRQHDDFGDWARRTW